MANNSHGPAHSYRVYQAQGMVSVQANCAMDEALALIADRATLDGLTLDEIADAVVDHRIRFGQ